MKDKKEELFALFSISLALIACAVLVYMVRTPSLTGSVVLGDLSSPTTIAVVVVLILAALAVLIGAIIAVYRLKKETEEHKQAIGENKTQLADHPDLEIAQYVLRAKQQGFSDEQILSRLKKDNWKEKEIKKYLFQQ
jgi:NAD/NADP transhydrogenase alpha subunit